MRPCRPPRKSACTPTWPIDTGVPTTTSQCMNELENHGAIYVERVGQIAVAYDVHPAHLRRVACAWTPTEMLGALRSAADSSGSLTRDRAAVPAVRLVRGAWTPFLGPRRPDLPFLGQGGWSCRAESAAGCLIRPAPRARPSHQRRRPHHLVGPPSLGWGWILWWCTAGPSGETPGPLRLAPCGSSPCRPVRYGLTETERCRPTFGADADRWG